MLKCFKPSHQPSDFRHTKLLMCATFRMKSNFIFLQGIFNARPTHNLPCYSLTPRANKIKRAPVSIYGAITNNFVFSADTKSK
jgi:hypothetical protein